MENFQENTWTDISDPTNAIDKAVTHQPLVTREDYFVINEKSTRVVKVIEFYRNISALTYDASVTLEAFLAGGISWNINDEFTG